MKNIIIATIAFLLMMAPVLGIAQQQNKSDEKIVVKKSDLPPELVQKLEAEATFNETKEKIETYGNWVGMGKEIGTAVNDGITAVKDQAVSLSETKLGYYIMFLIAYKVIGTDIIQFVIGFPLLLVVIVLFVYSYYKNCIPRQVLVQVDGDKKVYKTFPFETSNHWDSRDMKLSQLTHFGLFLVSLIVCFVVIFA